MASFVQWVWNEHDSSKDPITQTSPRSWWDNITTGFKFDDNKLIYNQLLHPYQGALYYNTFRNHGFPCWDGGLRFWRSASFYTLLGSLAWECCGEGHRMAVNDLIATTLGGWAFGEMAYRTSSWMLSRESGRGRCWREWGAGLLNPARFLELRIQQSRVWPNDCSEGEADPPQKPVWEVPSQIDVTVSAGSRHVLEPGSYASGFAEVGVRWGSVFDLGSSVEDPEFEMFSLLAELNLGPGPTIGRVQVQGNLGSWDVRRTSAQAAESRSAETTFHKLLVVQHLDYFNNPSFQFGAQTLGLAFFSNIQGQRFIWRSRLEGTLSPMAAITSEHARLVETENQERLREYDYTVGPGVRAGLAIARTGATGAHRRILDVSYQYSHLFTVNGSDLEDYDSWHKMHLATARLRIGEWTLGRGTLGMDVDGSWFFRRSVFTNPTLDPARVSARSRQLRAMFTWEERTRREERDGTPVRYLPVPF